MKKLVAFAAMTAVAFTAGAASAQQGKTLEQIKQRGFLSCGTNPGLAGFGLPDDKGNWTGLDVELCRAISAAIFNDPNRSGLFR